MIVLLAAFYLLTIYLLLVFVPKLLKLISTSKGSVSQNSGTP